ncbi:MAG: HepT-like ribonuclease domain-containing protein [Planctomycetota bacterium]
MGSASIGMRNILVHDYFHVDIEAVWSVVENDLPVLYDQVNLLLREY